MFLIMAIYFNNGISSAIIFTFLVWSVQSYTLYPNLPIDFSNDKLVLSDIKRTASSNCENCFRTYCIDTCENTCSPYRYTTIMAVIILDVDDYH